MAHPLYGAFNVFRQVACSFSVGGGLVMPTRPASKIMIEDSAASIHCTCYSSFFYDKRSHDPDEIYLILDNCKKMHVPFFGCVDVVMYCAEDVAVTLGVVRLCLGYVLTFARLT